jgi:hypothetical protein
MHNIITVFQQPRRCRALLQQLFVAIFARCTRPLLHPETSVLALNKRASRESVLRHIGPIECSLPTRLTLLPARHRPPHQLHVGAAPKVNI